MMKNSFFQAFRDTLPVMAGYIVLGIGFGILLSTKGYNFVWAFAMCLAIYSGTMQYMAIELFSDPSLINTAITAVMSGARHLFYGISMVERYKNIKGLKKFYLIYALTDETYSLVSATEQINPDYCFWVSLLDHSYWITGSVLGAVLGEFLPFDSRGIDFSLTSLFLIICTEQWLNSENHTPALIGFSASLICLLIFGAENFLVPSMALITISLFMVRGKGKNV
ncbi:MAG: AzlC family ABC transporter permease [Synergistaceae bacterium]|nr:AzlC family ABC transporter permease [Synergistaceae bacterium]MBR0234507.1 AzlC family ABC transporter permease [Synergistaceae bacterium]